MACDLMKGNLRLDHSSVAKDHGRLSVTTLYQSIQEAAKASRGLGNIIFDFLFNLVKYFGHAFANLTDNKGVVLEWSPL